MRHKRKFLKGYGRDGIYIKGDLKKAKTWLKTKFNLSSEKVDEMLGIKA